MHPSFNSRETIIKYDKTEIVKDINDIEHTIVKTVLQKLNISGVEITSIGDIPPQTGLGSSSSFTVGLLLAAHAYKGESIAKQKLAEEACEIEIDILKEPIGKQDQFAAAYGNLRQYIFLDNGSVNVDTVQLPEGGLSELEGSLLLIFTGITRSASKILRDQAETLSGSRSKREALQSMVNIVPKLRNDLEHGNIKSLGEYLDFGWNIKRGLTASITNTHIDSMYNLAKKHGATGGKLLGAGGGGFILLSCPLNKQKNLIKQFNGLCIPIKIDHAGAKIIYQD
jgi:hypothetical protein